MGIPPSSADEYPSAVGRAALVVGHPGHELKLFGWMRANRPRVYVITDGSGRTGISRLPSTAKVLDRLRSKPGEIFGCLSDAEVYRAIVGGRTPIFLRLVDVLRDSLILNQIELIVGDAMEGFNPTHDLCRAIVDAAVVMAERQRGMPIANYEVLLNESEQEPGRHTCPVQCLHFDLEEKVLQEKLVAAQEFVEMRDEVTRAIAKWGTEYFRIECLKRIVTPFCDCENLGKPYYELWGEQRVKEGGYESVIRYKEHMLPILNAIRSYAGGAAATA